MTEGMACDDFRQLADFYAGNCPNDVQSDMAAYKERGCGIYCMPERVEGTERVRAYKRLCL